MNPALVVDIGNTSTSLAMARGLKISNIQRTPSVEPALKLRAIPKRAVIASVKPGVNKRWKKFLKAQGVTDILWVNHTVNLGLPVSYPKPETIGADRLANACEAAATYGSPVVVCDFGTALTFDIVKKREGYVGGIICPGLPLMFDYLAEKTALLPHIKPVKTTHVVGKSTEEAMRIGAHLGYQGMVKEILAELKKELGRGTKVCATGGFAQWVFHPPSPPGSGATRGLDPSVAREARRTSPGSDHRERQTSIPVDPNLTLKGLARIATLN